MRLRFRESLRGYVAPAADHEAGFDAGRRAGSYLAFRALATIEDLEAFQADPQHTVRLEGMVDYAPVGRDLPIHQGVLHLFVPADPGRRLAYRIPFAAGGQRYLLLGEKRIRGRPGYRSMTTLYGEVYPGWDDPDALPREPLARGQLRVPLGEALRFPLSFRVPDRGRVSSLGPALRFLWFARRELTS